MTRSNVYIDDRGRSIGLLEFANGDDADRAVRHLDGEELKVRGKKSALPSAPATPCLSALWILSSVIPAKDG